MNLYRAFATVGGFTMMSRLFGFIRDILIAAVIGTGFVADAFFVAFRFPNLFRRLFGEGAFNSAFVPLFAKRLEGEGQASARQFAEEALACLTFVLILFSALAMIAMPWLMLLLAPGFVTDPEKYDLAVLLTRIAFPYLLCMSLAALLSGVLNSMGRFLAAAAAPILLNITMISAILIAMWLGWRLQPGAGVLLSIGVTIAGILQLGMLWIAVRRAGMPLRFRWPQYTEGMKRLVSLGIPGVISGGITQINIAIGTIIASLQAGAVSYLYYADRLYQLPLSIIGVAVGVVLLPDLSRKLRAGDTAAVHDSQNRSLEFAMLFTIPASVALVIAAEPIIRVLFERGAFSASDTSATAAALAAFSFGLPSFVLIKVFQPAFFAREDTRTPMWFAAINLTVNAIGSLALFFLFQHLGWMPHIGIAIATTLAGWINAGLLIVTLKRSGDYRADRRLVRNLWLILLASGVMGASLAVVLLWLAPFLAPERDVLVQASALAGLVALGLALYAIMIVATGVLRIEQIRRFVRRSA
ncbi:MAG: murein biosynthesis integral membrane protein MurJ [Proteobacteria bacterium]|nr:MAG: murein biosynthesis integral membrane protein MurJ [Pseudomonadota bacterium]